MIVNIERMYLIFDDLEIIQLNMDNIKNFSIGDIVELHQYRNKDMLIEKKKSDYFHIQVKNNAPDFKILIEKYKSLSSIEIIYDNNIGHDIYLPKDIKENRKSECINKYVTGFYGDNNCLNIVVSKIITAKEVFIDLKELKGSNDKKVRLTDEQIEIIKNNVFLSNSINLDSTGRVLILELDEDQYMNIIQ